MKTTNALDSKRSMGEGRLDGRWSSDCRSFETGQQPTRSRNIEHGPLTSELAASRLHFLALHSGWTPDSIGHGSGTLGGDQQCQMDRYVPAQHGHQEALVCPPRTVGSPRDWIHWNIFVQVGRYWLRDSSSPMVVSTLPDAAVLSEQPCSGATRNQKESHVRAALRPPDPGELTYGSFATCRRVPAGISLSNAGAHQDQGNGRDAVRIAAAREDVASLPT